MKIMKNLLISALIIGGVASLAQAQSVTQIVKAVNSNNYLMRYFKHGNTKLIVTRSDADILSDGDIRKVPVAQRINDKYRQNQLASGLKLNPYAVNYTVIPDETKIRNILSTNGVKLLSIYYVLDISTGQSGFGIVGDVGPGGQVTNGEFSVHQIQDLNLPVDKRTGTGGKDANSIVTIIFPNSDNLLSRSEIQKYIDDGLQGALQSKINAIGEKLLKEYSLKAKTQNLEVVIQDLKSVSSSVKDFD